MFAHPLSIWNGVRSVIQTRWLFKILSEVGYKLADYLEWCQKWDTNLLTIYNGVRSRIQTCFLYLKWYQNWCTTPIILNGVKNGIQTHWLFKMVSRVGYILTDYLKWCQELDTNSLTIENLVRSGIQTHWLFKMVSEVGYKLTDYF